MTVGVVQSIFVPDGTIAFVDEQQRLTEAARRYLSSIVMRIGGEEATATLTNAGIVQTSSSYSLITGYTLNINTGATFNILGTFKIGSTTVTSTAAELNWLHGITLSNGGVVYSTATQFAVLTGTATARQMLQSSASVAPAWSTTTWPATTTINRILFSSATNTVGEIDSLASGVLVTNSLSVPSLATDLPTAVTIGSTYIYRVSGTDVAIADGGTGQSTAALGFNALSPITTKADLITSDGSNNVHLGVGSNTQVLTADSAATTGLKWATPTTGTVTSVAIGVPAAGITQSGGPITGSGTITLALANDLAAVEGLSSTGIATRTATDTWTVRTMTGTAGAITITNGDGVSGNPTYTISATYAGQISITTLGTVTAGTWNATQVGLAFGGTNAALTASNGGILYSTVSAVAILAGTATANKMLLSNATSAPSWSTSTIPTSAGATANKVLLSDGTNYVLSTPTFPNASATAGKFIRSDGTNWIASTPTLPTAAGTAGKVLMSDATNYIESTPTYPSASGSAGKVIRADGTNNPYSTFTIPDTFAAGDTLYASTSNVLTALAKNTSATRYFANTGASNIPAWAQVNISDGITGFTSLTEDTTPDITADYVMSYDNSATTQKKVLIKNLNKPLYGRVYRNSTAQSIPDSTYTKIQYNTVDSDPNSLFDTTTNYRMTVPTGYGGLWLLTAAVALEGLPKNTDIQTALTININGTQTSLVISYQRTAVIDSFQSNWSTTQVFSLSAGDYAEVTLLQSSGGAARNTMTLIPSVVTYFIATRLGST